MARHYGELDAPQAAPFGQSHGPAQPWGAGGLAPAAPASPVAPGYEFTPAQNTEIQGLAGAMTFVGTLLVIAGGLQLLGGVASLATGNVAQGVASLQGVLHILLGTWTRGAAQGFDRIVKTQGHDIDNLMSALAQLKRVYGLHRVVLIITMVLLAAAFLVGMAAALVVAASKAR
jgi:hypothetical protein